MTRDLPWQLVRTRVRTQVRTRRAGLGSWEENELDYLINFCVFTVLIENRNLKSDHFRILGALLFHINRNCTMIMPPLLFHMVL